MTPALSIEPNSSVEANKMHRNNFGNIVDVTLKTVPSFWLHIVKLYCSVWLRVIRRSRLCGGPLVTAADDRRRVIHGG